MAEITLKDGDFGSDVTVTVGETAFYLPDRARPGLNEMVPLTAVAEIENLSDDHSGQLKEAARLGVKGFLTTGNPLGLAAGVLAVRKVKDVEFAVLLKDGRRFVAVSDAGTLANLRGASHMALVAAREEAEAAARADAVIARYLGPGAVPPEAPAKLHQAESSPAEAADPSSQDADPARRVFGRRGVS